MQFQSIQTFTYQKTLLYTLLLLVSKVVKSYQCISLHLNFRHISYLALVFLLSTSNM